MPPAATSSKVAVGGGHKVTTVADGALASAAPPADVARGLRVAPQAPEPVGDAREIRRGGCHRIEFGVRGDVVNKPYPSELRIH